MKFTKMHGTGNDFIVIEDFENKIEDDGKLAKELCHRHFSIGGDGILYVRHSEIADIKMVIINADGSYASMCGNGIRCFAKYIWDNGIVKKDKITIETGDGIKIAHINTIQGDVEGVAINMGFPSFNPKDIPAVCDGEIINKDLQINDKKYIITTLLMGVPHTVILGCLDSYNVEEGKLIERYSLFPEGTNVNFCEVVSRDKIKVKTWERGAGATLACGTGSCAAAIACNKLGFTNSKVNVEIPGGDLEVDIRNEGVYMTGAAKTVYKGEIL